jgi:hypothetical protein
MRELFVFLSNISNIYPLAFIFSCVVSVGLLSFIWGNAHSANVRLSSFQWIQIYGLGLVAFLSGILILGFLIVPKNAEGLLDLLRIKYYADLYVKQVQAACLWFVKLAL